MKKNNSRYSGGRYLPAVLIFILFLIFLYSAVGNAMAADLSWEDFSAYLEDEVPLLMEEYHIPGANIAVMENGEIKRIKSYGLADREQEITMTADKIFRGDSISKMVTAWGVMNLVEQGKINLDDPAENYLTRWSFPETEFDEEKITVRMLLSHRSGLPSGIYNDNHAMEEEIPSLEKSLSGKTGGPAAKPVKEPGESFVYSNPGFAVLELIIEEVSGYDYADYMEQEILTPLGMNNSGFRVTKEMKSEAVTNYKMGEEAVPFHNVGPVKAPGELYTTVEDLSKFIGAWMKNSEKGDPGGDILSLGSIEKLHTPEIQTTGMYQYFSDSYGLGHFIKELPDNQQVIFHGGEGSGSGSIAGGIPEKGVGIIILTNSNGSWQLLAAVLDNWVEYLEIEWQGISRIFQVAETGGKIVLGVVLFVSFVGFRRLIKDVISGRRKFQPLSETSRIPRLLQFTLAVAVMGIWWGTSINEFLVWLLRDLSFWLEISLKIFSSFLVLSAVFTKESKRSKLI